MDVIQSDIAITTAKAVKSFASNSKHMLVIDIAAGTGQVGAALRDVGFKGQIDAIESNEEQLKVLKKKKIYSKCIQQTITSEGKIQADLGKYDFVTCVGGFNSALLPSTVKYMVPLLKQGGIFVYVTSKIGEAGKFHDELERVMRLMEKKEIVSKISEEEIDNVQKEEHSAVARMTSTLYCYQKLENNYE